MDGEACILVVDDELDMCWALENILRSNGYQTMAATTAQEALKFSAEESLGIALIDVVLPDMDGIELAALIRHVRPDVIVIVISGSLCEGDKVIKEGLESDAFAGFVSKPFELAEVRRVVKTAVNGR
jgi:DNA-binding NtrC family response regulator